MTSDDIAGFGMWVYGEAEKHTREALGRGKIVYIHQVGRGKLGAYRRGFDLFRKAFNKYETDANTQWGANWGEVERAGEVDIRRYEHWLNDQISNLTPPEGHDETIGLGYDSEMLSGFEEIQDEFLRQFPKTHVA